MPDYVAPDLSHLHPTVRGSAQLPAGERVELIRADRWIGYPKAVETVARLEALLGWPDKQRMPNLLLVGPTNNGKSMIVEKFRRGHLPVTEPDREHIPVLCRCPPTRPCCGSTSRSSPRWAHLFNPGCGWPTWSRCR